MGGRNLGALVGLGLAALASMSCERAQARRACEEVASRWTGTEADVQAARAVLAEHEDIKNELKCDQLKKLIDAQRKATRDLDATMDKLGIEGDMAACVKGCRDKADTEAACIGRCGCTQRSARSSGGGNVQVDFWCQGSKEEDCAAACKTDKAEAAREAKTRRCLDGCAGAEEKRRTRAVADEAKEEEALRKRCCEWAGGSFAHDTCRGSKPGWHETCLQASGRQTPPTAQGCCSACGGVVRPERCEAAGDADRCFMGCLRSIGVR